MPATSPLIRKFSERGNERRGFFERYENALDALRDADETGARYVPFTHRWSTSEGWKKTTTARPVVRVLMRSPAATPYIIRRDCIQHYSVSVAAIRPDKTVVPVPDVPEPAG